jgi:hypothetical protein
MWEFSLTSARAAPTTLFLGAFGTSLIFYVAPQLLTAGIGLLRAK